MEYTARVSESRLALVHFTVQTDRDAVGYAGVDVAGLQDELTEAVRTWDDRLLSEPGGPALAAQLAGRTGGVQGHHTARAGGGGPHAGSPRWRARSTSRCASARPTAPPTAASPSTSPAPRPRSPTCCRSCSSSGSTSSTSVPRSSSAPTACACTSTTSASGSTTPPAPRSTPGPRPTSSGSSARRSARRGAATSRPTGSPPSCCARACPGARSAVLRAYARYARQIGAPYGLPTWRTRCSRTPTSRAGCWRSSGPGSTRRSPQTATRRSRTPSPTCAPGSTPSPGSTPTASCAASSR